jgi:anti-repressor protein
MNQLQQIFQYQQHQLRTVIKDGEPWFVAKDVCEILEITNPTMALQRLDDDERAKFNLGRQGETNIVNEPGLYTLILGSRKPEAKQFKRWVTHEVIPSIRKHGAYMTPEKIEEVLLNPDTIIKLATELKEERRKRIAAEQTIVNQKPLVSFAETCMASDKSLLVREVAKLISKQGILIGEKRLFQKLREWKLIFPNKNEPYQEYIDRGYFEISQGVKETDKGSFTWLTMRVTPKGQVYIINRLRKELGIAS